MSQAGIVNIEENNPQIPTRFDGNTGFAVPLANVLEVVGDGTGVEVVASGNQLLINYIGSGGAGDVVGPASAVANNFASYDGATGKLIKDSGFSDSSFLKPANNLNDLANAGTARTNLGLAIGTNVQAYDQTLQSISSLGTAANKMIYTTGVDTWAEADISSFGRSLIDDADATAARSTLGLIIGTNVQAYDATLQSLSALGTASDRVAYTTGVDTWAETPLTSFARSILDDTDAASVRSTIGAGTGNGDVTGPGSSVSGNIATFSGTTGKSVQDSGVAISLFSNFGEGTVQTTNNTITTIRDLPLSTNSSITIQGYVKCIRDDFTEGYFSRFIAMAIRGAGNVSLVGFTIIDWDTNSTGTPVFSVTADTVGQNLRMRVTGETSKTFNWTVRYWYI